MRPTWKASWVTALLLLGQAAIGGSSGDDGGDTVADTLHRLLAGTRVESPAGDTLWVVAPPSDEPARALLSREQIAMCVETLAEAEAWPAAWLVVQHADRDFDLVLRVERDEAGQVATGEFVFTVPRRDWQPGDMKGLAREATGKKPPRQGIANIVIQGFSRTVSTTYRYQVPRAEGGLGALLAEGAMIREAQRLDLPGGEVWTVALVIEGAEFLPSECGECAGFGHADTGSKISLVLAEEGDLIETLDLTLRLAGHDTQARVPRYECYTGDGDFAASDQSVTDWFAAREKVPLISPLSDLDGDGRALELTLPARPVDCNRFEELIISIVPEERTLRVTGRRRVSASAVGRGAPGPLPPS
jgi:hypothetical protein